MTTLSIQIKNAKLVRKGLQDLEAEVPKIGAQQIFQAIQRAKKKVTTYPPELPDQQYVRTGRYGRGWKIRRQPGAGRKIPGYSLIGRAEQRGRRYERYVGGDAYGQRQAQIHADRWVLVRDAIEQEVDGLPARIEKHIGMVARRKGL